MQALCVIPARYASTRLPGKPLADICGKPMIVRVYERVKETKNIGDIIVATDDERIKEVVEASGGKAYLTAKNHPTGTDRIAEVVQNYQNADIILNVQGDEPLIEPSVLDKLLDVFQRKNPPPMATVKVPMTSINEINNPSNVKVITDRQENAIYFSRSPLPYFRSENKIPVYKHIGIYAYKRDFLLKFAHLPQTPLEKAEMLEQLRALEHGYRIFVIESKKNFIGVDTKEDLEKVREIYPRLFP